MVQLLETGFLHGEAQQYFFVWVMVHDSMQGRKIIKPYIHLLGMQNEPCLNTAM